VEDNEEHTERQQDKEQDEGDHQHGQPAAAPQSVQKSRPPAAQARPETQQQQQGQ